jgi:Malectin domain
LRKLYSSPGASYETSIDILGTSDNKLFQSERPFRRNKSPPYVYEIPVDGPNEYVINLHFAEIVASRSRPGLRVFDVWVEGVLLHPEFDIVGHVGAQYMATTLDTVVNVTDGSLTVEFTPIVFNPTVSAIAVYRYADGYK